MLDAGRLAAFEARRTAALAERSTVEKVRRTSAIQAQQRRSAQLAPPEQQNNATVVAYDAATGLVNLTADDGASIQARNVHGGWLLPGQRVFLTYLQPQGAVVIGSPEARWASPQTFGAPWTAVAGLTPRYRRDSAGNVLLQGQLQVAAATAVELLFTLPNRHRPGRTLTFPVWLTAGLAYRVTVAANGQIRIPGGSGAATALSFDGIVFLAEA